MSEHTKDALNSIWEEKMNLINNVIFDAKEIKDELSRSSGKTAAVEIKKIRSRISTLEELDGISQTLRKMKD